MKKEQRLWQLLRDGLQPYGHWTRIENLIANGTPDVNFALSGAEGWLELKSVEEVPVRAQTPVFGDEGLSPDQIEWLVARARAGGSAFVFARAGPYLMLIPGSYATRFNDATLTQLKDMATFWHQGRMVKPKWKELGNALIDRKENRDYRTTAARATHS